MKDTCKGETWKFLIYLVHAVKNNASVPYIGILNFLLHRFIIALKRL